MATVLKCSAWRCSHRTKNVEQFVDDRDWDAKRKGKPAPKATLKNILCRMHAGVERRRKYGDREVLPLTEADVKRLLKEQAALDAEARVEQDERDREREQRDIANHAQEWVEMDLPAKHAIMQDPDRVERTPEEPVFEGHVWLDDGKPQDHRFGDTRWFQMEPTHKYYMAPPEGARLYPYVIRLMRGANLSPNEARALATALTEAADKAEELNATRKPA